ncbi:alpha-ketoglutarate-dependent dioxygenase alkB homolog 3 isoform X4 [Acipenser ruthenus]|nr:alpha-ketoglutarate-dependent dioxygenase alkB homolog 3 isoform X4 [Acipenser ruthenus]XP_058858439.1 alpha-ketoglutarate-dependent dioxygenase alkB homolog 3 isoform X4 [Acipenser ruthenus]XP_058858440.1 alpha-ketoglutarate-dependent dioxygenase alkB homolog 3 isoform X4 [Acipenser ruthenus]
MADKRQRVRIQGSWAGPARKPAPGLPAATGSGGRASLPCAVGSAWGGAERTFEFQQPTQVKRKVPEVVIMEKEGEFEISQGPSGVSRLRLIPSFLPVSEADWMFAQLLADLPWKQKSNLLHGESYEEPRLTCWFGELPYTYSHSTLQANTQWHPVLAELRQRMELASGHSFNSLLCNLYRDGKDSIAWHSDSEPSLRPRPTIGSLSLGDTRNFEMRKQPAAVRQAERDALQSHADIQTDRERERERERETPITHMQTHRQTERHPSLTCGHTDRDTGTHRHRDGGTERYTGTQRDTYR